MLYHDPKYKDSVTEQPVSFISQLVIAGSCPDPIIRDCKYCSEKIEFVRGQRQPINYRDSSPHKCLKDKGKGDRS